MLKVTEISISIGATIATGNFENVKIQVDNTAVFDKPVEVDSPEYRKGHATLCRGVAAMLERVENQVVPKEDK